MGSITSVSFLFSFSFLGSAVLLVVVDSEGNSGGNFASILTVSSSMFIVIFSSIILVNVDPGKVTMQAVFPMHLLRVSH